jgi:hypothetical protein
MRATAQGPGLTWEEHHDSQEVLCIRIAHLCKCVGQRALCQREDSAQVIESQQLEEDK